MKTTTYVLAAALLALLVSCASTVTVPVHVCLDPAKYEVISEDTLKESLFAPVYPFQVKKVTYKGRNP